MIFKNIKEADEYHKYPMSHRMGSIYDDKGIINSKSYVGRYATSMEMAGMSISILKLDDELEKLLLEDANCPFWY